MLTSLEGRNGVGLVKLIRRQVEDEVDMRTINDLYKIRLPLGKGRRLPRFGRGGLEVEASEDVLLGLLRQPR